MATERQRQHAPPPTVLEAPTTAKERMAAKVRTSEGKALYARRKVIVEPVFGQIKEARGFRRFLLRGLEKIRGEWRLVCLTHNLLKLWRYGSAHSAASDRRTPSGDGQCLVRRGGADRNCSWRSQDEVKDGSHRDPQATKYIEKSYGSSFSDSLLAATVRTPASTNPCGKTRV